MTLPRRAFVTSYRLNKYVIASWCLSQFVYILRNQTAVIAPRIANFLTTRRLGHRTMVSYDEVISANSSLHKKHEALTAVFAGATSGIGLETLKAFAKHIPNPRAIIIGRNRNKFEPELQSLRTLNPNGHFTFLESEISLIKNIDTVCHDVRDQLAATSASTEGSSIDLLFLSQGYLLLSGRHNNSEGLDNSISLRYYGRVRMVQNLLPHMSPDARIVSVLAGGKEGHIFTSDMDLERNFSIMNAMGHFTSLKTLSLDYLATANPGKSFIHIFPGFVSTGSLGKYNTGIVGLVMRFVETVSDFLGFSIKAEESGERTLYYGTCAEFEKGGQCWVLDWDGRVVESKALKGYRETAGTGEKVMEHNKSIFERVTS